LFATDGIPFYGSTRDPVLQVSLVGGWVRGPWFGGTPRAQPWVKNIVCAQS